jgi:hypothetical protein
VLCGILLKSKTKYKEEKKKFNKGTSNSTMDKCKVKPSGGQSTDIKPIFAYFIYDGPLLLACEGISEEVKTQCHSG